MKIPQVALERFWQASVKTAEALFKYLPEEVPLFKRKILETIFARFCYESTVETVKQAGRDPAEWERQLNQELEIFRTLLLGLVDLSFDMAFKALEGGNVDALALARKDEYYSQLTKAHSDPFLAPIIEILVEVDRRWFVLLWEKHGIATPDSFLLIASRSERTRRVATSVLGEAQTILDSLQHP